MARKKSLLDDLVDAAQTADKVRRGRGGGSLLRLIGKRGGGISAILLILLFVIGFWLGGFHDSFTPQSEPGPQDGNVYTVVRCVDGDTLLLDDGSEKGMRVRLIGANSPETVKPNWPVEPYGPEASEFTKKTIADSDNRVRLVYDGDRMDKFGRTLGLVYVQTPEGEKMLNELLIREGLATAETKYNYSKDTKERFRRAEEEAKTARRNLWSP